LICQILSAEDNTISDELKNSSEILKDSIATYEKLPQETSELYKRYFINIPMDLSKTESKGSPADEQKLIGSIMDGFSQFNLKFDAVFGNSVTADSEYVKIKKFEDLSPVFDNFMHKNDEDKYVSYIFSEAKECIMIDVPDNKSVKINLLFANSGRQLNTMVLVKIGNGAKVDIFEYYGSTASSISSIGVIHEIIVGDNSEVEVNALHNENSNTVNLGFAKNQMGADSRLKMNSVYSGGIHTRVRNTIRATSKNSRVDVNEMVFGASEQKFDISTYVVNRGEHSIADLESKAALMDNSFCIMKGFAKIEKGATKARSYVHERGILLDSGAKVYGLPDMSVDENDVKATHSSATSPVDPESVFYLMSKGIDMIGVRKLLVAGFFSNSISKFQNNMMKVLSMSLINSKLETKEYGEMPKVDTRNMWAVSDANDEDMFKGHYKYRGN
jgi:Fe-S cluster assembly scaffold protein SufB